MKSIIVQLIFLLACNALFAQQSLIDWDYGKDSTMTAPKKFWDSGKLKLENRQEGKQLFRYQYHPNGKLQLKAAIDRRFLSDTVTTFDPETYEETIWVEEGYFDFVDGPYIEYFDNSYLARSGQMENHFLVGKWIFFYPNGNVKEKISYNKRGHRDGKYQSFYEDGKKESVGNCKASFPSQTIKSVSGEDFEGKFISAIQEKSFKVGRWKHYSVEGWLESVGKYMVIEDWHTEESFDPITYKKVVIKRRVSEAKKSGKWKYYSASGKKKVTTH